MYAHESDLPVVAVATVAHGPDNEGVSPHKWPKDERGECVAVLKTVVANTSQHLRECEGGEGRASAERILAHTG